MVERTVTTRRLTTGDVTGPEVAILVGALLLAAVWVLPLGLAWDAVTDPEGTYRQSPVDDGSSWNSLSDNERDAARAGAMAGGAILGIVAIAAIVGIFLAARSGRAGAVMASILVTVVLLAAALALRANGYWADWPTGIVVAAAVAGVACALIGLFAPDAHPIRRPL